MKNLTQNFHRWKSSRAWPIQLLSMMVFMLFSLGALQAQTAAKTVSGVIQNAAGEPLIGVNILVKGTNTGTVTDIDGAFSLQARANDVLEISYIGFASQSITVGSSSNLTLTLAEDANQLDEVVVIGYGSQKKSDLTGSVGTVSGEELNKYTVTNASQVLQGRIAGVQVESNGGGPGAEAIVTIRGASTLSDQGPLYVIDGMLTGSMSSINPSDIESVTVLKDASALAIYGSRAANGVVIVTTKQGSATNSGVDVEFGYGTQKAVNTIDWANARQYADIVNRARDNDGNPRFPANDDQFDSSVDSDIQAATLRTAPMYNAGARFYGGGQNLTYAVSGNYTEQQGILRESDFTRMNLRLNSTFRKGKFKFQEAIGLTRTINNPNNYFNRERDLLPTVPIRDANGEFTGQNIPAGSTQSVGGFHGVGNIRNSLGLATIEDRTNTGNNILGTVSGTYEIMEGFFYKLNLGLNFGAATNYRFSPTYFHNGSPVGNRNFAELDERNFNSLSTLAEHTLNYRKYFNKHSIDLLAGYSAQKSNTRSLGVVARRFPSNDIRVASAAEDLAQAPSFDNTTTLVSQFGRINYTYNDRYILTATLRRDGSSLFTEDLRWGIFPSFAVGWNIGNEGFMEGSSITGLKLRASYGETGANNTRPYAINPSLNLFSEYIVGVSQGRVPGYSITNGVNPNIFWETTKTTDIGLEFGVMQNKLRVTADYFIRNSEDVLVDLNLPLYTGFGNAVPFNTASIENKGVELGLEYRDTWGDLNFSVFGNFSTNDNIVTALGNATPIIGGGFTSNGLLGTKTDVGQPVGSFFGYRVAGIYQTDQEAADANDSNNPQAGDLKFTDLNNDGMIDAEDQEYLGSGIPDFMYALNLTADYKGFDATLFFNGVSGNEILNGNRYRGYFDTEGNFLADALNAWTPSNTGTDIPRNTLSDPGFNRRMSDFYLEKGGYFRLRNIQVGYSLADNMLGNALSKVRVYVSAQNLFTITDYTGYYPEVGRNNRGSRKLFNAGVDESAYPTARTFMFGVQATF